MIMVWGDHMRFWVRQLAKQKSNKGFTLVELIVVLTILGIMAAILVPQLLGYVDQAKLEAEYVAGENCRLAAQMQLDTLHFMEQPPNLQHEYSTTNDETCASWAGMWSDNVKVMSGQEIYHLVIGIGKYSYYSALKDDPVEPYTVYIVGYQRTEDSPIVFYDGENWSQNCPWKNYNPTSNSQIRIGDQLICIQFLTIQYDFSKVWPNGDRGRPEGFFNTCKQEY